VHADGFLYPLVGPQATGQPKLLYGWDLESKIIFLISG